MKVNWWSIKFGKNEQKNLVKCIRDKNISQGKINEKLENQISKLLNIKYVCTVPSGTSALTLALYSIGIKPGDEVLVPNRTWVATAHSASVLGAKVRLVDVKKNLPIIDEKKIIQNINKKTKAIICVHLNGRICNVKKLKSICKKNKIHLIEDCAQAFFSKYNKKYAGSFGDLACFSLGVTKLISSGQGGFVATKSKKIYRKIKLIKNHGVVDNFTERWSQPGFNFKFTDILSSVALCQLKRKTSKILNCINIYKRYEKEIQKLKKINLINVRYKQGELPIYVEALVNNRRNFINFMSKNNVQIRPLPPSLNNSKYFISKNCKFLNSKVFEKKGVYLPCGPDQPLKNINYVIKKIKQYEKI